jgi:hypothetical protein
MKWLVIACTSLVVGCEGPSTFIDLQVTLADGAPAPSTLTVSVFDEYGVRLDEATKNATLPRLVHIDASAFDDRTHALRLVVRGGPSLVVGSTRVSPAPGTTASASLVLSADASDRDGDEIPDVVDDCPDAADPAQLDSDGDGSGDACTVQPHMASDDMDQTMVPSDAGTDLPPPDLLPGLPAVPIAFRSAASNDLMGSNTHVLTRPTGVQDRDVLIAMLAIGYSGDPNPMITPPAGWSPIRRIDRTDSVAFAFYWRRATASEPPNYSFGTNNQVHGVGLVLAYSGVDLTAPVVIDSGQLVPSSASQYSTTSITPGVDNTMLVATFTGYSDLGFGGWMPPAGTSGRVMQNDNSKRSAAVFDRLATSQGASGAFTSSVGPEQNYALVHVMALRPAQ